MLPSPLVLLHLGWVLVAAPSFVVPSPDGAAAAPAPPDDDDAPPPTAAELDALAAPLAAAGADAAQRLAAARRIAALPPLGMALYRERLLRERPLPVAAYRALVLETGAQVPNPEYPQKGGLWMQKPPPPPVKLPPLRRGEKRPPRPKRPPRIDPEKVDWLAALAALDLDATPELAAIPERVRLRAEALETVALLQALAATRQPDAAEAIFELAFRHEGVFRDECGRALRSMESHAIPTLVGRLHHSGKGLKNAGKQKRWALWQLDRMDRARPGKAITTAPDDRLRAAIIHAYGEARALDAVEAILAEVDAASPQVRREARHAWLRYVTGPPPPPGPKRKRKLPGGREESEEKEDYLNYREIATLALQAQLATLRPNGPAPTGSAEEMTRELLAIYDARRSAEWEALFAQAAAKQGAGDLDGAIRDYRWILAHDPFYPKRAEMAATFLAAGERALAAGDLGAAAAHYAEGAALTADDAARRRAEARVALAEGLQKARGGHFDPAPFRRALALDPRLDVARAPLDAWDAARRQRALRRTALAAGACLATGLALVGLLALVLRRRRPAG